MGETRVLYKTHKTQEKSHKRRVQRYNYEDEEGSSFFKSILLPIFVTVLPCNLSLSMDNVYDWNINLNSKPILNYN